MATKEDKTVVLYSVNGARVRVSEEKATRLLAAGYRKTAKAPAKAATKAAADKAASADDASDDE